MRKPINNQLHPFEVVILYSKELNNNTCSPLFISLKCHVLQLLRKELKGIRVIESRYMLPLFKGPYPKVEFPLIKWNTRDLFKVLELDSTHVIVPHFLQIASR